MQTYVNMYKCVKYVANPGIAKISLSSQYLLRYIFGLNFYFVKWNVSNGREDEAKCWDGEGLARDVCGGEPSREK